MYFKQYKMVTLEPFPGKMLDLWRSAARSVTNENLNLGTNGKSFVI